MRSPEGERRVLIGAPVEADILVLRRPTFGTSDWYFTATLRAVRRGRACRPTEEPIVVFSARQPTALRAGDEARVWLTLQPAPRPGGPLLARLKHPELIIESRSRGDLAALAAAGRAWAAARLEQGLRHGGAGGDTPGVALALAFGERAALSDATAERLRRSGLSHLLAVSGLNVAVVMGGFGLLARLSGVAPVPLMLLNLFAGALYAILLPPGSPVARAGLMALAPPVARLVGRPARGLELLGGAALVLMLLAPGVWKEPAFALSFAVTAFLLRGFTPPRDGTSPTGAARIVAVAVRGCVVAALGSLPLGLLYFGELTPGGVLLNLVAVPLGSVLLLIAVLAAAAALVHPLAAAPAALVLDPGVEILLGVADLIDGVPAGRLLVPAIGPLAAAGGLGLLFVAIDRRCALRRRGLAVVMALATLGAAILAGLRPLPPGELAVRLLDVGQGDALLVGLPGGGALLVDGGRPSSPTRSAVRRGLAEAGVRRLRALVLSHDHLDHVGGLADILREIAVEEIWLSGLALRSATLQALLDEAGARRIPVRVLRAGDSLWRSNAAITCLHPARHGPRLGPNADSLILLLEGPRGRLLLTGDLDAEGERRLAAAPALGRVDVLKIPHHGSRGSATAALLERTRPRVALISVGRRNPWGHPHAETLERLQRRRIPVLRTDRHGTLTLAIRAEAPRLAITGALLDARPDPP